MEPMIRVDTQESLHSHAGFRSSTKYSCNCFPQTSNVHVPSMIYDNISCNHGNYNGIIQPAHEQVFSIPWTPTSERRNTSKTGDDNKVESKVDNNTNATSNKKISIPALKSGSKNQIETTKNTHMNTDSPRVEMETRETRATKSNIMKVKVRPSERNIESPQFNTNVYVSGLNTGLSQQRQNTGPSQRLNTGLTQRLNTGVSQRPMTFGQNYDTLSQRPISFGRTRSQPEETKSTITTLLRSDPVFSYTDPWDREAHTYRINYTGDNKRNVVRAIPRTSYSN